MFNLINLINEINAQISTVSESFVFYDKETGKIQKISNKKIESDLEVFKIETDLVKNIILGRKRTEDFVVVYDLSEKRLTVKEITQESALNSVRYKLYEIPKITTSKYQELKSSFSEIYKGVHVDVWYNNLKYLKGQHVWHDNSVYILKNNQSANLKFNFENTETILEDVKLFDDENKFLDFDRNLKNGDKLLNYNKLYLYQKNNDANIKDDFDVLIRQDHFKKCWEIVLGFETKNELLKSNYKSNDNIFFSITEKNDPNVLYRTIQVSLSELIYNTKIIDFQHSWEFNNKDVSIYTPKFFKTYMHEVTNDKQS